MKLPNKKITNYVEQPSGSELLIYNLSTDQAYCLNETAAEVFAACDGATSFEALQTRSSFSSEMIYLALAELRQRDLIESDYISPFAGMNRRELIRKAGLASMVALPVISSLIAPPATMAASACRTSGQSCTGNTSQNTCCANLLCFGTPGTCSACTPAGGFSTTCEGRNCCSRVPEYGRCCSGRERPVSQGSNTRSCACN